MNATRDGSTFSLSVVFSIVDNANAFQKMIYEEWRCICVVYVRLRHLDDVSAITNTIFTISSSNNFCWTLGPHLLDLVSSTRLSAVSWTLWNSLHFLLSAGLCRICWILCGLLDSEIHWTLCYQLLIVIFRSSYCLSDSSEPLDSLSSVEWLSRIRWTLCHFGSIIRWIFWHLLDSLTSIGLSITYWTLRRLLDSLESISWTLWNPQDSQ